MTTKKKETKKTTKKPVAKVTAKKAQAKKPIAKKSVKKKEVKRTLPMDMADLLTKLDIIINSIKVLELASRNETSVHPTPAVEVPTLEDDFLSDPDFD
jgi:hypothetical protein